jgi:DNA-binding beta-propeller fold protein YncE
MKSILLLLSIVLVAAFSVTASGAGAGGGPVTILFGGQGVLSPDGKLRYVALTTSRQTIVSVVRVRGGQVTRWRLVRGYVGVPIVGSDGTTEGVSADGRTLVLGSTPGISRTTRFAVIDTKSLKLRRIELPGSWSYDAISPDGKTLFLVEYLSTGPTPPYRVRAYDLGSRRLLTKIIVDRVAKASVMYGQAVTRATSPDGRWAYTLYARAKSTPFVHALDTVRRQARCVFMPLSLVRAEQLSLRLRLERGGELAVHNQRATVAVIDTRTFKVRRS